MNEMSTADTTAAAGDSDVPPTPMRSSLPGRTLSRKSSMGLDKTKGYDFSFSKPNKADADISGDIEAPESTVDKYQSLQRYILSTGGKWSRLFHAFWLGAFALMISGVVVATLVVPTQFVLEVQKKSVPDSSVTCLRAPYDTCDAGNMNVYFMNVTNAEDVLDGVSGPVFEQVGPFHFTATKYATNEYIAQTGRLGMPVSALRHNYTDKVMHFNRHLSCPTCDLSLNIVGPNAIYLAMMKQTGWSETTLVYSMVPTTLSTVIQGMDMALAGMGRNATNVRAINQWASCAELGGMSFSEVHTVMPELAPLTTAFQASPPEFCAYAQSMAGSQERQQEQLSSPADALYLDEASANRILLDPAVGVLNPVTGPTNVGIIMQAPAMMIASIYGISALQASLLQGYIGTVVFEMAKNAYASMLGPRLESTSSGLLIKRTVDEWVYGYTDTLVTTLNPTTPSTSIGIRAPVDGSHVAYDPNDKLHFHSAVIATGKETTMRDEVNSLIEYNGERTFSALTDLRHYHTYLLDMGRLRPRWVSITGIIRSFVVFLSYPIMQRKTFKHFGYGEVLGVRTVKYRLGGDEPLYHCNASTPGCRQQHTYPHVYDVSVSGPESVATYGYFAHAEPGYKQSVGPHGAASLPVAVDAFHTPEFDVCYAVGVVVAFKMSWQKNFMVRQTDLFHNTTWNAAPMHGGMWIPSDVIHSNGQIKEADAKKIKDALKRLKSLQQITLLGFLLPAAILLASSIWYFCLSAEAVHKRDQGMVIKKRRQQSIIYKEPMKVWDGLDGGNAVKPPPQIDLTNEVNFLHVSVKNKAEQQRVKTPKCCG